MLGNILKKDDDKEKAEMAEGMQSMSDQIGALSKQLAEKNAEIDRLKASAKSATADNSALQAAQQQVADLQKQLRDLQRKVAEDQAAREAEAMAADLIRKQKADAQAKEAQTKESASAAASGGLAVGGPRRSGEGARRSRASAREVGHGEDDDREAVTSRPCAVGFRGVPDEHPREVHFRERPVCRAEERRTADRAAVGADAFRAERGVPGRARQRGMEPAVLGVEAAFLYRRIAVL